MHLRNTKANTPGSTQTITTTESARTRSRRINYEGAPVYSVELNSTRIATFQRNIITQAAVDAVTANVYYDDNMYAWAPSKYLRGDKGNSNTNHDIKHFCALVVHPKTGETITSYKS